MNKQELLENIKDNMYWDSMFAHVWKDDTENFHLEFNTENVQIDDIENYIGKVNLSEWYWNDTENFDIETEDEEIRQYVYDCIYEGLQISK